MTEEENKYQLNKDYLERDSKNWLLSNNLYDAAADADAIIFLTDWDEFYNLNYKKLYKLMRSPCWIFDTRNVVNSTDVKSVGFKIWKLGDGALN